MTIGLILGGARSGKSGHAQRVALSLSNSPLYVATSRVWDEEHQKRVARHRAERGPEWRTIEEEKSLSTVVGAGEVVLVECVTLWLTNYFLDCGNDADMALQEAKREFDAAVALDNTWLFVSNEIGQGTHAMTESGRRFTDLQGFMNQYIARHADWVVWMVAGIAVTIEGTPPLPGPRFDGGAP